MTRQILAGIIIDCVSLFDRRNDIKDMEEVRFINDFTNFVITVSNAEQITAFFRHMSHLLPDCG